MLNHNHHVCASCGPVYMYYKDTCEACKEEMKLEVEDE